MVPKRRSKNVDSRLNFRHDRKGNPSRERVKPNYEEAKHSL
ncbi:MAG: hypothetical protein QM228_03550 [Atribacterota bacterium]|nr:hypothetical protein [Atribacterota bacterium]